MADDLPYRIDTIEALVPGSLVGSFFLGDITRQWQGRVVAEPAPGTYLVETFEWVAGFSCEQRLVRLVDMTEWSFYDTAEWMKDSTDSWRRLKWKEVEE